MSAPHQYGTLPERLRYWARHAQHTHARSAMIEAAQELDDRGYTDPDAAAPLNPNSPRLSLALRPQKAKA